MKEARLDGGLSARVIERRPLVYDAAAAAVARTVWVRSASALAWFGGKVVIAQDDALWLAQLEGDGGLTPLALPAGDTGERLFDTSRKRYKPDFEAAAVVAGPEERLLVFGSGSTPARERIGVVERSGVTKLVEAGRFYASLRAETRFSGSELNIEGALVDADTLVLFSRGNGAVASGRLPVNATLELNALALLAHLDAPLTSPVPGLGDVEQYWLGEIDGVRLTFTDAALRGGVRYYIAAAEASVDAVEDGPVSGVSFGVLAESPRYTLILAEDGERLRQKVEGLAPAERADEWLAVVDVDEPSRPAELLRLRVAG